LKPEDLSPAPGNTEASWPMKLPRFLTRLLSPRSKPLPPLTLAQRLRAAPDSDEPEWMTRIRYINELAAKRTEIMRLERLGPQLKPEPEEKERYVH